MIPKKDDFNAQVLWLQPLHSNVFVNVLYMLHLKVKMVFINTISPATHMSGMCAWFFLSCSRCCMYVVAYMAMLKYKLDAHGHKISKALLMIAALLASKILIPVCTIWMQWKLYF